jgi:hypothetical protein
MNNKEDIIKTRPRKNSETDVSCNCNFTKDENNKYKFKCFTHLKRKLTTTLSFKKNNNINDNKK